MLKLVCPVYESYQTQSVSRVGCAYPGHGSLFGDTCESRNGITFFLAHHLMCCDHTMCVICLSCRTAIVARRNCVCNKRCSTIFVGPCSVCAGGDVMQAGVSYRERRWGPRGADCDFQERRRPQTRPALRTDDFAHGSSSEKGELGPPTHSLQCYSHGHRQWHGGVRAFPYAGVGALELAVGCCFF